MKITEPDPASTTIIEFKQHISSCDKSQLQTNSPFIISKCKIGLCDGSNHREVIK
ncbi:hypothetical protein [Candidatus Hodarchaeum mangrovi]